ncbi:MAG TPA: hypothetical protein VIM79_26125 [Niastella sp.]
MKKNRLVILSLMIFYLSCSTNERRFFISLKDSNPFLDSFSSLNLKGFGLSLKGKMLNNHSVFEFNKNDNSIGTSGDFYESNGRLFFLPTNSDKELILYDKNMWYNLNDFFAEAIVTKDRTSYETSLIGVSFNKEVRDSTLSVAINRSSILNKTESVIFEVTKGLDVSKVVYVNCKNDTLVMVFLPKEEVYYKCKNNSTGCL